MSQKPFSASPTVATLNFCTTKTTQQRPKLILIYVERKIRKGREVEPSEEEETFAFPAGLF